MGWFLYNAKNIDLIKTTIYFQSPPSPPRLVTETNCDLYRLDPGMLLQLRNSM